MPFRQPPRTDTAQGRPRRVGLEIEYSGIAIESAAEVVARETGGEVVRCDTFEHVVHSPRWGGFLVEMDSTLMKSRFYKRWMKAVGLDPDEVLDTRSVDDALRKIGQVAIPYEIVTPPIPLPDLPRMESLREALRRARAEGTGTSMVYAFGLHLNPEMPDLELDTVLRLVRAYALLEDALRRTADVDLSRRVAPFIVSFPEEYVTLVADPDYRPDMPTLIDDFVRHNPTRDRSLDMLPLLASIDADRVLPRVERPDLVKPRPAPHYRLPDCRIDDPDWRIATEWNRWVSVERLADDPERLDALGRKYLDRPKPTFAPNDDAWIRKTRSLIE